jgi:hypothetical protein
MTACAVLIIAETSVNLGVASAELGGGQLRHLFRLDALEAQIGIEVSRAEPAGYCLIGEAPVKRFGQRAGKRRRDAG